jgi:Lar family restriction alleviation protein
MIDSERVALLPCPFCGESDFVTNDSDSNRRLIACGNCGAEGPGKPTENEAIAAWNTRAALTADAQPVAPNRAAICPKCHHPWPHDPDRGCDGCRYDKDGDPYRCECVEQPAPEPHVYKDEDALHSWEQIGPDSQLISEMLSKFDMPRDKINDPSLRRCMTYAAHVCIEARDREFEKTIREDLDGLWSPSLIESIIISIRARLTARERVTVPEALVKFIQIAAGQGEDLYALGDDGKIYAIGADTPEIDGQRRQIYYWHEIDHAFGKEAAHSRVLAQHKAAKEGQ